MNLLQHLPALAMLLALTAPLPSCGIPTPAHSSKREHQNTLVTGGGAGGAKSDIANAHPICDGTAKIVKPSPGSSIKAGEVFDILYCSPATLRFGTKSLQGFSSGPSGFASGGQAITGQFNEDDPTSTLPYKAWKASAKVPAALQPGPFQIHVLEQTFGFGGDNVRYSLTSSDVTVVL